MNSTDVQLKKVFNYDEIYKPVKIRKSCKLIMKFKTYNPYTAFTE